MIILIILSILTVSCAAVSAADVDDIITDVQSDSINLEAEDSSVDIIEASEADQGALSEAVDDNPVLGATPATSIPIYEPDNNWSDDHIFDVQPTAIGKSFLDHIEEVSAGNYYHHPQHPLNLYYTSVRDGSMYIILDMGGNDHFKTIKLSGITGLSNDYEIINDLVDPNGRSYSTICLIRFDNIRGTTSNGGVTIQINQRPKITVSGIKIYNDTETILYVNDKMEDTIYLGEDATLKANVVMEDTKTPVTSGTVKYYLYSVNGTVVLDMSKLPSETPIGTSAPGGTIPYLPDAIGDYEFIAWYPVDDSGHNGESHSNLVTLHVIEPPKLDLSVQKNANVTEGDELVIGVYVKFTITVTNLNDTVDATGVVVNDKLPTGLRFVSSNDTDHYDSSTGDWTVGNLNAGESKVLEIVAQVTTVNEITNTATLTVCRENDTNPDNNVSSVTLTPHPVGISLALTKEVSNETPLYGSEIDYTITVINLGSDDAHDIVVTDILPEGLEYVSDDADGKYDSTTGKWNVGTIKAGENMTLTITVKVQSVDAINNTANITGHNDYEDDPVKEDDFDSVVINPIPVFDLELHKSILDSAEDIPHFVYGSEVVYTIVVTNNGPCVAKNVIVKDLLPAGLEFVDANDTNYDSATGEWTVGDLDADGIKSLEITAIVKEVGSIVNLANITDYDGEDSNLTNNDESVEIIGDPKFDLGVSIEVINPVVLCGQTIKYIVTVVNNGPCAAYNVEVTDILPSIFTYVSSSSSADAQTLGSKLLYASKLLESASGFDQSTGKWAVGDLNVGDEVQLEIIAKAVEVGDGTIKGSVSSDDFEFDTDETNNEYAADVKVLPCADLSIEKSVDKTEIKVGETVTYTFTVTNNGPNDATGVKVTDEDITKHTFVSASDDAYDSSTGVWTVGDLANGESKTLTVTVKITEVGEFANTATVSGDQDDNDTSNNEGSSSNVTVTETEDPDDPVDPVDPAEPAEPAEEMEPVMPKAGNPILALLLAIMLLTGVIFERKE